MLSIKRTVHVQKDVEIGFPVAELVEKFTEEELKSVGLYRELADADIARLQSLDNELRARAHYCDDEDCQCPCHEFHSKTIRRKARKEDPQAESTFWKTVRQQALRHDAPALIHALEQRAWSEGGVTVDLTSIISPKG